MRVINQSKRKAQGTWICHKCFQKYEKTQDICYSCNINKRDALKMIKEVR